MARRLRIKVPGHAAAYHLVSRVHGKEMLLKNYIKSVFLKKLTAVNKLFFSKIIAFTILENHIHILVNMADPEDVDPKEAMERWNTFHEKDYRRNANLESDREYVVNTLTDISRFMKKLNLLLTRAYNRHTGKVGTLWQSRFHSTIFERGLSVLKGAAYIDLNSFRASMVNKPEEYKYCSLHHLKEGNKDGLIDMDLLEEGLGIAALFKDLTDREAFTAEIYRTYLAYVYEAGTQPKGGKEKGIVITKEMKKRLKKYRIEGEKGSFPKKTWEYSKSIFVGNSEYAQRFYDEHINPGYSGKERKRHIEKWIHTRGKNLCSVFSIFHKDWNTRGSP